MGLFNRKDRTSDDRYEGRKGRSGSAYDDRDDYDYRSSRDDRSRVYRDASEIERRRRSRTTDRTDTDMYGSRRSYGRSPRDLDDYDEIDRQIDRRYGRDTDDSGSRESGLRDSNLRKADRRDSGRGNSAGKRKKADPDRSPLTREELSRKKERNKRMAVKVAIFVVLLVVAVGLAGILYVQAMLGKIGRVNESLPWVSASDETFEADTSEADTIDASDVDLDTSGIEVMKDDDVKNILLIGQDQRSDETSRARSDTMIICSINTETHKVILSSLMRDMYVAIPGYSANKINASYAFGGMELLDQTIEKNFGVPIDGNVEVNLDGFIEALSVVGNLNIELNEEEAEYINSHNYYGTADDQWQFDQDWTLHEGMNEMTPSQCLAYSRIRYVGNSDWERTQRQRTVIMTAFKKVMEEKNLGKIIALCNKIFPYLSTDMDNSELLSYIKTIVTENMTDIEDYRIPVDGSWDSQVIKGMSCLVPNLTYNSSMLKHYIYGTDVDEASKDSGEYTTDKADESSDDKKSTDGSSTAKKDKSTSTKTAEPIQAKPSDSGSQTTNQNTGNNGGNAGANTQNTGNTGSTQTGQNTGTPEPSNGTAVTPPANNGGTDGGGNQTPANNETTQEGGGTAGAGAAQGETGGGSTTTPGTNTGSSTSGGTTYGSDGTVTGGTQENAG